MTFYPKFRDLRIGDRFEFTSGLFAGPFVKDSPRKYSRVIDGVIRHDSRDFFGETFTVGSINVAVNKIDAQ